MQIRRARWILAAALGLGLAMTACSQPSVPGASGPAPDLAAAASVPAGERLDPGGRRFFGVNLDWGADSPAGIVTRMGRDPAVYVVFESFPLQPGALDDVVALVRPERAALLLTLEPSVSLGEVSAEVAETFAEQMRELNLGGVPVLVRFAHEMNGSWYPWSQQPDQYVRAFTLLADAVHDAAPLSAMLWAPNYGGGYPFTGGVHGVQPGTPDFVALDTDADGALTPADDPYGPYYPGDDAVDWVGLSVYHWGDAYPWGENEVPEPGKFEAMITGQYVGSNGDEQTVPDFHAVYAVGRGNPMAVTETAALFVPGAGGADEATIKRAWWEQVLDPDLADRLPALALVNWFEWRKYEVEIGGMVDWRVTADPDLARTFTAAMPPDMAFARDLPCTWRGEQEDAGGRCQG